MYVGYMILVNCTVDANSEFVDLMTLTNQPFDLMVNEMRLR